MQTASAEGISIPISAVICNLQIVYAILRGCDILISETKRGGISIENFIPHEKLSKKEKRKIDQAKRQTWGELNPVTRKPENSKAYNRNKARNWKRDYHETSSGYLFS